MFLLDDAVVENGCMRVIPASHRQGVLEHRDGEGRFVGHGSSLGEADEHDAVDFIVKAGTMTVHHCLTLHASYPNFSDTPRRGLVYQISAGDAIQLGGNLHKVWGTMLAGADPQVARLENGPSFTLPSPLVNRGGLDPAGDWRQATDD
jgi:ectoine hydroxylase-related dioxygenase (phytanoyl-CoA dioxygenase family)